MEFSYFHRPNVALASVEAVGFDLFETLIFVRAGGLRKALNALVSSLGSAGFRVEGDTFVSEYIRAARAALDAAHRDGRETHNRFWIASALKRNGIEVSETDQRISDVVENYFEVFVKCVDLIPGTAVMLERLCNRFSLGLLTNFTHPPAAREILERLSLTKYFDGVLISGDLGYRKPHKFTFSKLIEMMGTKDLVFVGDNIEADVEGARAAGIQPVWVNHSFLSEEPAVNSIAAKPERRPGTDVLTVENWLELETLLFNV